MYKKNYDRLISLPCCVLNSYKLGTSSETVHVLKVVVMLIETSEDLNRLSTICVVTF